MANRRVSAHAATGFSGWREKATTVCPRSFAISTMRCPMNPDAPVMPTFITAMLDGTGPSRQRFGVVARPCQTPERDLEPGRLAGRDASHEKQVFPIYRDSFALLLI